MITYLKRNAISFLIGTLIAVILLFIIQPLAEKERAERKEIEKEYVKELIQEEREYEREVQAEKERWELIEREESGTESTTFTYTRDMYTQEDLEKDEAYYDSLELLALLVEAEAGNQDAYGKALVCDVVLNRVDSEVFPDSITEVIYQEGQFAVVSNGFIDHVEATEETYDVVWQEVHERTNDKVFYFCSLGFLPYGEQWEKIGDHYFCIDDGTY